MLKRLVNELHCKLSITTTGPVLIKSGQVSVYGPDMSPVQTYRNNRKEVYLPGSSLKGVIRSHIEKICRTLVPNIVCNPFIKTSEVVELEGRQLICPNFFDVACSDKFEIRQKGRLNGRNGVWTKKEEKLSNPQVYSDSCPVCRLFGSNSFIGRISIGDAYLKSSTSTASTNTEVRDGVGIDRLTGGAVHGAKFEMEVVSTGVTFETNILIRNFECWQIGMLLIAVSDLEEELIRIGSGRSRGLGAVKGELTELTIHTLALTPGRKQGHEIWGLGKFLSESEDYGTFGDDTLTIDVDFEENRKGLRYTAKFNKKNFNNLTQVAHTELLKRLDNWSNPKNRLMQWKNDWVRG